MAFISLPFLVGINKGTHNMLKKVFLKVQKFLSTPIGIVLFISPVIWHITLRIFKLPYNIESSIIIYIFDFIVTIVLLDRLIYFFAQFVLPIQNKKDRHKIYVRVRDFNSDKRGHAIFIKNGRIIKQKDELERKGPGVIILDTASATVLRTDIEFKDTVGPGVRFTEVHKVDEESFIEYPAESVDLRTQWKFIGPMASDDPFINPVQHPKEYNLTNDRQQKTNSWTRDGFEISATISIKFQIKRITNVKTESGVTTEYKFDPTYVRKAIIYDPLVLEKNNNVKEFMKWDKLPEKLVINLWREYVRKYKLDEIFYNQEGVSGLQKIEDMINRRVQVSKNTLPPMDIGLPSDEPLENPEYKQLIERGIEVIKVTIHNVTMANKEIEKQVVEQWSSEWLKLEKKKEELLKKEKVAIEAYAPQKAKRKFASIVANKFISPKIDDDRFVILQKLIEPLRIFMYSESRANKEFENTSTKLNSFWNWLLSIKKKS